MKTTDKQLAKYLYLGVKKKNIDQDKFIADFVNYLVKNKLRSHLSNILRLFTEIHESESKIFNVTVISKYKISPSILADIQKVMYPILGVDSKIVIHEQIDENSLGGLKIKVKDQLLDISLESQLRNIGNALLT